MTSFTVSLDEVIRKSNFNEFPSGKGSWNDDINFRTNGNLYTPENLIELMNDKVSPWYQESDVSDDVHTLRTQLIVDQCNINKNGIIKYLNHLRLVNRGINELNSLPRCMMKLSTLILSLNSISNIPAEILPKYLKVLELYSNKLSDVEFCCSDSMPLLEHLGCGLNFISDITILDNSRLKTTLVSLDLSENRLTDIYETLNTLSKFVNLKVLVLAGNPLSLVCFYRGYIIDRLKNLMALDDKQITADERYHVRGMNSVHVKNQAEIKILVSSVKNIKQKENIKDPTEEPLIKTDYYVWFNFPFPSLEMQQQNINLPMCNEEVTEKIAESQSDYNESGRKTENENYELRSQYATISGDELPFQWVSVIPVTDLQIFADTLSGNMMLQLVEETKIFYSPENLPSENQSRVESRSSKKKGAPKSASKQKNPASTAAGSDAGKKHAGGDKKKKLDESKMVLFKTKHEDVAHFNLDLSALRLGEVKIEQNLPDCLSNVLVTDVTSEEQNVAKPDIDKGSKTKKHSKEIRGKSAEKSKHGKIKTPLPTTDEEIKKPIECNVLVELLSFSTAKALNRYNQIY